MPNVSEIYDSIIREPTKNDLPTPPEETPAFAVTNAGAYEWTDDANEWQQLPLGSAESPLAAIYLERERIKKRTVYGHALDDHAAGRAPTARWASWPMQLPTAIASYPVNKTKPVLMFHSEGTYPQEYDETFPRMKERGIPWMMAATPNRIGSGLEREQVMEMLIHGCEIGLYTANGGHLDERVESIDDLEEILLDQKRELEEMGFPVMHMMPRKGSGVNTDDIDAAKTYMTRTAFVASGHGYAAPSLDRPGAVGNIAQHGVASIKIEDGDQTADEAKAIIDRLVQTSDRLRFFFHTHYIDDWDRMEEILDYAVEKRRQGELDLATSTGGLLIPWDLPDGNIVNDPDASFADTFDGGLWKGYGGDPEIRTTGGHTGDNYWAMGTDITGEQTSGIFEQGITLNPTFPAGMIDFYARAPGGEGNVTVRLDSFASDVLEGEEFDTTRTVGSEWTRVFVPFGVPRADAGSQQSGGWRVAIFTTDAEVHLDDINIYPC
ncbi:hypothetical protein [Halegenticoccus tardaugens]|uniref:hypothetical protein n=1 Tax=Halegenticoccus tardaugens TaxID=2071624 RepID=UPI00100B914A|nr:hypothetical protein [Halegenticoccus tardaugens]